MRKAILLLFLAWVVAGCCRHAVPQRVERSDSVRTQRVTEYVERVRWDTVTVEVPAQSTVYSGPADSSYLETEYASSVACVLDDGSLYHDLFNKPATHRVVVPVVDTNTNVSQDSAHVQTVVEYIPVDKSLKWWQTFLIWSGVALWLMLGAKTAFRFYQSKIKII